MVVGCSADAQSEIQQDGEDSVGEVSEAHKADWGKHDRSRGDSLYVGTQDDTVKRFNAKTGAFESVFVTPGSGGLLGPRGLVFGRNENLLVVNQNVDTLINGEILKYERKTGAFLGAVVSKSDRDAAFSPRGMVLKDRRLYVASMGDPDYVLEGNPAPNPRPARVAVFKEGGGEWLGDIAYGDFDMKCVGAVCTQWSPRALVFGPDGALYVTLMKFASNENPNLAPGRILKISEYGTSKIFVDGDDCGGCGLARPEGLAFGPNGKLYVTSFRKDPLTDNDKILVFNGKTGAYEDKIDLDVAGAPRAFSQAILFGPRGKLFVSILGNGPDTGSVRRYDVRSKTYDVFVPAAPVGPLVGAWYMTFGKTDPATLAYDD
ncbi:MAG: hypothetical protein KF795_20935 [Labilithrix sp.]|nr:hypothetical protein [Labilithrix sp.]